ncbi:uncharacterized protein LOC141538194 [Cotesia typhae]|uniref:uncharacterized protein LOC141538194 n=1 Tax=Cotesia typhae TaxID=2053667 RepID=UPI003D693D3C
MSDFPHLLKCFRTKILEGPSFWTPDGIVKKIHWEVLLQHELQYRPNLKVSYKLTPEHIHPEGYQKMNVRLAEELFSKPLRVAMMTWQNDCTELQDCGPTIKFMERVDNLIKTMSSRTPESALRSNDECPMRQVLYYFQ